MAKEKTTDAGPTPLDQLNTFLTANPSAQAWVEEVLIRGAPGSGPGWGIVQGAHFTIGIRTTDPFGNPVQQITPPFSAADVPSGNQTPISQVVGAVVIQQQTTIDQQASQITALTTTNGQQATQIATLTSTTEQQSAQITALTTTNDQQAAQIGTLTTTVNQQTSQITQMTAQVQELQQELAQKPAS